MADYRRLRIRGGTYFFTVNLADRASTALVDRIDALRRAFAATAREHPFRIDAVVILPDHLHAVWALPAGDADFSIRWKKIKTRFTKAVAPGPRGSPSKTGRGEMGLWQRRFWEHAIRDDEDCRRHVEYCWINPVKHGLVARVADWPHSSFHREVRRGIVPAGWGGTTPTGEFGE
jgi:putative transposase